MADAEYVLAKLKELLIKIVRDPETRFKSFDAGEILATIAEIESSATLATYESTL